MKTQTQTGFPDFRSWKIENIKNMKAGDGDGGGGQSGPTKPEGGGEPQPLPPPPIV